ncbi:uncharacterized protein BO88DRAFT_169637 [Aspergillus vadensis CBS 113365]|uniref:Uncharacterized protein n=1 Tax=Aspergillus vadensis (strain CBS 113365 / IMI 142717 / IBT 24658) TaxID=1448311 RepID=A0A319BNQ8_ASPVC|nr:hypothetical protein BO88DRAFT_169637 [Aspergillus vadensis CBS 113365]PYH72780.1 hypothetical protein BO88DRAFT_169637 [Aspergillus vadensis CBS 113365]
MPVKVPAYARTSPRICTLVVVTILRTSTHWPRRSDALTSGHASSKSDAVAGLRGALGRHDLIVSGISRYTLLRNNEESQSCLVHIPFTDAKPETQ